LIFADFSSSSGRRWGKHLAFLVLVVALVLFCFVCVFFFFFFFMKFSPGRRFVAMKALSTSLRETSVHVEPSGICIVRLNRPLRGNAYTARMADELDWIFRAVNDDNSVKVVILAGTGDRFCVGADLGEISAVDEVPTREWGQRDLGGVASLAISDCRKVVIAAMHGAAVGIGITMVLPCDIRVVEEDCKIGFLFAKRGLSIEAAASFFLPRVVGLSKALELCLTARIFEAKTEPTLFSHVVPKGHALKVLLVFFPCFVL
jgi:enoyl-CoA hydratase/carnithine racemase